MQKQLTVKVEAVQGGFQIDLKDGAVTLLAVATNADQIPRRVGKLLEKIDWSEKEAGK